MDSTDNPEEQNEDALALKSRLNSAVFCSSVFAFLAVGPFSVIDFLPSPLKALCPLIWGLSVSYQHYLVTRQRPTKPEKEDLLTTMLSTEFRPALLKIMNFLDPKSFVRFSRTCKSIRIMTQCSKGVRVPFRAKVIVDGRGFRQETRIRLKYYNRKEKCNCAVVGLMLKNLQKLPFQFNFEIIAKQNLMHFNVINDFLANFKRSSIDEFTLKVQSYRSDVDWKKLAEFIQNYNIKRVYLPQGRLPIPPEFIDTYLRLPIDHLECKAEIPVRSVTNIMQESFDVHGTNLTAVGFKRILREILEGRLNHLSMWTFSSINSDLHSNEAFLGCFEGIQSIAFDFSGELPQERPLLTSEVEGESVFLHVLTPRDKLYTFRKEAFADADHSVHICPFDPFFDEVPAAFEPFLDDE